MANQQGKRLGSTMINYVINDIKASGACSLELNVNRNNPARLFYEKIGFKIAYEEDIDIGQGYYMNDYVMRIAL
jgi:ribosomal protein S18 acetylase RimI-like enzyme